MLKEFLWKTFEYTGNIDSYMLFREIEHKKGTVNERVLAEEEVAIGNHTT